jgi:sulfite reductase beta subunit-like hemoprotein
MLRNPICQRLPRKFKTAFSSCPSDCAGTPFHDMGFQAVIKGGVKGFRLSVGGGTSTMARQADTVWDFATADDGEYIKITEAILRVFDREGDMPGLLRRNLNKARIKFLLHKIGVDRFRELVVAELKQEWAQNASYDMEALMDMAPKAFAAPRTTTETFLVSSAGSGERAPQTQASAPSRLRSRWGTSPPSSSRCYRTSCVASPAAWPAPIRTRTWSCAGCARRR